MATKQSRKPAARRTRKVATKSKQSALRAVDTSSAIEHVIVLMMENRSFDHMLGAVPNVDGVDPSKPNTNLERQTSSGRSPANSGD
jgi:phospholipase C